MLGLLGFLSGTLIPPLSWVLRVLPERGLGDKAPGDGRLLGPQPAVLCSPEASCCLEEPFELEEELQSLLRLIKLIS